MGRGAYILGCAGPRLTKEESRFFDEAQPWGFILFARNIEAPDQVRALTADLRTSVGRNAPVLIDQEGGRVQRMGPPHWRQHPPPLDLLSELDAETGQRAMWLRGRLIAEELVDVGIDVNCAPLADIATDTTHPFLKNRCYGTDAETVSANARAMAEGLVAGGVLPVLKHTPGHGRSVLDTHFELPRVDAPLAELERTDFAPFRALADLPMAMSAHLIFDALDPARPVTVSSTAISYLRETVGITGFLMTDDISMNALGGTVADRTRAAIAAGCDAVLHCNGDLDEMRAVADAAGAMTPAAHSRADAALAARPAPVPIDIAGSEAELRAMERTEVKA